MASVARWISESGESGRPGLRLPESPGFTLGSPVGQGPPQSRPGRRGAGRWVPAGAVLADLCAVAIYAVVGRSSHHESLSAAGLLATSWPFVVGVGGGYIGTALTGWPATGARGGAVVVVKTLILGLVLRYGVARAGTPFPFIVVTVLVLTALMAGWRSAGHAFPRRR